MKNFIQSAKTRPGADCGRDHELLIDKFRLKLKKVWRLLDHSGINSIKTYDYTVEVTNRFSGFDLIDRLPTELCAEVCNIVQEAGIKTNPKENKCKKAKWLSDEALQIAVNRRELKGKGTKGKIHSFECRVPKNSKER